MIYAAQKVVDVRNRIDEFMATQNYLPSRYNYVPIDHEEPGVFTSGGALDAEGQGSQGTDFTQLLESVIDSNTDMETLIKDKFLFSQEKILGFLDTNPVQLTLREEVEQLHKHITQLNTQIANNQMRLAEQDKGENNTQNLQAKIERLTLELEAKDNTIHDLNRSLKEIKSKLSESQKRAKVAEEQQNRLVQSLKPRLQQAMEHQKVIFNDFNQIKEDTQLLPMIFRAEAAVRTKALDAQKEAENEKKEAVAKMGALQQKIDNLEQDKNKAKQLSIKAIAARSQIKQYLDDEKAKVGHLEHQMQVQHAKLLEAESERLEFQNKHD